MNGKSGARLLISRLQYIGECFCIGERHTAETSEEMEARLQQMSAPPARDRLTTCTCIELHDHETEASVGVRDRLATEFLLSCTRPELSHSLPSDSVLVLSSPTPSCRGECSTPSPLALVLGSPLHRAL